MLQGNSLSEEQTITRLGIVGSEFRIQKLQEKLNGYRKLFNMNNEEIQKNMRMIQRDIDAATARLAEYTKRTESEEKEKELKKE